MGGGGSLSLCDVAEIFFFDVISDWDVNEKLEGLSLGESLESEVVTYRGCYDGISVGNVVGKIEGY